MFLCLSVSDFNTFIDRRHGRGGERRGGGGRIFNVLRRPGLPGFYSRDASVRRLFLRCAVPLRRPLIGQTDGGESVGRKGSTAVNCASVNTDEKVAQADTHTHTHTPFKHTKLYLYEQKVSKRSEESGWMWINCCSFTQSV